MEDTKVVEMGSKETTKQEDKKMSYEELSNVAHQLSEQTRQLYNQLQNANMNNVFRRLDYLFRVVENGAVFHTEFLNKCISEIEDIMDISEEQNTEKNWPNLGTVCGAHHVCGAPLMGQYGTPSECACDGDQQGDGA